MIYQRTLIALAVGAGLAGARPAPWSAQDSSLDHFTDRFSSPTFPAPVAGGTIVKKSSSKSASTKKPTGYTAKDTGNGTAGSECTFTDIEKAMASKASCPNIVLKDITVPAGKTLDMEDLADGTTVSQPFALLRALCTPQLEADFC